MKLESKIDASANFVERHLTGFLESRYVSKVDDYFICYLSSHNGCNQGCRFCHLTTTRQTMFEEATFTQLQNQATEVMRHYLEAVAGGRPRAKCVHVNFMARGEPLLNRVITGGGGAFNDQSIFRTLHAQFGLPTKFNISTIMPVNGPVDLTVAFPMITPTIYYSMYSVTDYFRRKWLPAAMNVDSALTLLAEYQRFSKKILKIHYTFIRGENDDRQSVQRLCDALNDHKLHVEFNLVRYNPASLEQGEETPEDERWRLLQLIASQLNGKVKVIPRVGFDVKASCGMFMPRMEE